MLAFHYKLSVNILYLQEFTSTQQIGVVYGKLIPQHTSSMTNNQEPHHFTGENHLILTLEQRIQMMEDQQAQILQLLLEISQQRAPPQQYHQQNVVDDIPVELPHQFYNHHPNQEFVVTANSTHPSHVTMQTNNPLIAQIQNASHNFIRDELRCLIQEEFIIGKRNLNTFRRSFEESSPLTDTILQHPIPMEFKLPTIDSYDSSVDPYKHVDHYRTIMHIQQATDPLFCQVFPITFRRQKRTWFYSLPEGTIQNFTHLARLFVEQFIVNRRIIKISSIFLEFTKMKEKLLKNTFKKKILKYVKFQELIHNYY